MGDAERKRAVREWFRLQYGDDVKAGRAYLIKKTGFNKTRITQILTGDEAWGEKAAVNFARLLGLPDDQFIGRRPSAGADPDKWAVKYANLLRLWDPLFPEQKETLMQLIQTEYNKTRAAIKEMRVRGWIKEDVPEDVLPIEFTRAAQRQLAIGSPEPDKPKKGRKK